MAEEEWESEEGRRRKRRGGDGGGGELVMCLRLPTIYVEFLFFTVHAVPLSNNNTFVYLTSPIHHCTCVSASASPFSPPLLSLSSFPSLPLYLPSPSFLCLPPFHSASRSCLLLFSPSPPSLLVPSVLFSRLRFLLPVY